MTSLAFSRNSPRTLSVGFYDGSVAVYNTALRSATPSARCTAGGGSHAGPVWGVAWVAPAGGMDAAETLVSVAADGRVIRWSVNKASAGK